MSRRFTFNTLTSPQFVAALEEVGISRTEFCRLSGADERRALRWAKGEEEAGLPPWAGTLLAALTVPEALALARAYADHMVTDLKPYYGLADEPLHNLTSEKESQS